MKLCILQPKQDSYLIKIFKILEDLFSGKIICRAKQVYTGNKILDQIPMADDPDPNLFSCPDWLKDHNQAIEETHASRPVY